MLAMEFAAPVTLLIQMCDREPEREQEAMELIREFLKYFTMKINKKVRPVFQDGLFLCANCKNS